MYHYTMSGLSNVYLVNGYTVHGNGNLHIHNIEGLHRAIAWEIANEIGEIPAQDFRFLRVFADMGQRALGGLLSVGESTVSHWERGVTPVPGAAAEYLRGLVREIVSGNAKLTTAVERYNHLDRERTKRDLSFAEVGGDWALAA